MQLLTNQFQAALESPGAPKSRDSYRLDKHGHHTHLPEALCSPNYYQCQFLQRLVDTAWKLLPSEQIFHPLNVGGRQEMKSHELDAH